MNTKQFWKDPFLILPILAILAVVSGKGSTTVRAEESSKVSSVQVNDVFIAPIPKEEEICSDYELRVQGRSVPVYLCRVSAFPLNQTWPGFQRPLDQTETAGFAYWEMSKKVTVEITAQKKIENVTIRPLSLKIKPKISGQKISFTLEKAVPVVVEINDYHNALHLFPALPGNPPKESKRPGLHYFGPGIHDIGVLELKSGESVYIEAGAVVYGSFYGENISDVRIEGRGIIDGGRIKRAQKVGNFPASKCGGTMKFVNCKNIVIDGSIQRNPSVWTVMIFNCQNVRISNLSIIGCWRYNSDGIDICNSDNVLVEKCFVRAFDDVLVVKGLPFMRKIPCKNITFRQCTVWCDWGRAMEIGAETSAPEFTNILFDDCDIIRTTGIALDIQHYDEATVNDIRFENIRVEFDDWIPRQVFQSKKDQKYIYDKSDKYCSELMVIVLPAWRAPWSTDKHGKARNILFKNITVYANRTPPSSFSGFSREFNVEGVRIENVRFANDKKLTDQKALNLKIGPFVKNVEIR